MPLAKLTLLYYNSKFLRFVVVASGRPPKQLSEKALLLLYTYNIQSESIRVRLYALCGKRRRSMCIRRGMPSMSQSSRSFEHSRPITKQVRAVGARQIFGVGVGAVASESYPSESYRTPSMADIIFIQ